MEKQNIIKDPMIWIKLYSYELKIDETIEIAISVSDGNLTNIIEGPSVKV